MDLGNRKPGVFEDIINWGPEMIEFQFERKGLNAIEQNLSSFLAIFDDFFEGLREF